MPTSFALPGSIVSGKTSSGTAWSRCGNGPTIVLLHGVGMNKSVWAPEVNLLCESFDVLIYDMWGHGESDLPNRELSLKDYTQQLVNLLKELEIGSAVVAGHSMGALIALDFAINNPDTCLGVCAMNAVFDRTAEQSAAVKKRAAQAASLAADALTEAKERAAMRKLAEDKGLKLGKLAQPLQLQLLVHSSQAQLQPRSWHLPPLHLPNGPLKLRRRISLR